MKLIKTTITLALILSLTLSFFNCSSTQKTNNKIAMANFQTKTPLNLGKTYYKHWVAGVKGGGSGINLVIPVTNNKNNIILDSVYFRDMASKLETIKSGYAVNFKTKANQREDIIMSSQKNAEYGNQLPNKANFPFNLKDNECVVSYKENNKTKYFKIENIIEKPRDQYPSAPPRR